METKDTNQTVCVTSDPSSDSGRQQDHEHHVVYCDTNRNMQTESSEHASSDQPPTNTPVDQCTASEMNSENQTRVASSGTVSWYPYAHCTGTSQTSLHWKVGEGQEHSQVPISDQEYEKTNIAGCSRVESCYQYNKDKGSDSVSTELPSNGDASLNQLQIKHYDYPSDESQTKQYLDSHKATSDALPNNSYQTQNQCGYLDSNFCSEQH